MYILSMDFGTSSIKASLLDENNKTVDTEKEEYFFTIPQPHFVELDPDDVFNAMLKCIERFKKYHSKIDAIAYDTFSPSVAFMDKEGNTLYPIITHLDRRSGEQSEQIQREMGKDEFQSITGTFPFTGGASVTSMLWVKENMPGIYTGAYKIGHLVTYLYKKFTGCWATDPTNAAQTGMYETTKWSGWSKEILGQFGMDESKLPEIHNAGTVLAGLTKEFALLTGLKEGIPVLLGTNDATVAHVGAGNNSAGDILDISGSSEIITILTDKPVVNSKYYLRNAYHPGQWQVFAITTGGFAIEWFKNEFCREMAKDEFFRSYLPEIMKRNAHENPVAFRPYLTGDRQSLTKKTGAFTGLTLDTGRDEMLLSLLAGIHEPVIETIRLCSEFQELNKTIKLTGGLISENFITFKKTLLPGFGFKQVDDCPILGNGIMALKYLNNEK
jgi:xylulokinase